MAFPAAPTESGGAKIHFLTTDGNVPAGWFGVDTGVTGTGANTVGFAAVATHVEGDAVGAPGGLATTSVPVVLVAGDDGTNAVPLQLDGSGYLKAILQANSGVDIGDMDVLSMPATAAEAAALPSVFVVVAGDDGTDTHPLQLDASGHLQVDIAADSVGIGGGTQYTEGDIDATIVGTAMLWEDAGDTLRAVSAAKPLPVDLASSLPAGINNIGDVDVLSLPSLPAGGNNIGDVDVLTLPATAAEAAALPSVFVVVAGDDGTDTHPLQLDGSGYLKAILQANSGVDIGDVDVLSLPSLPAGANRIGKVTIRNAADAADIDPLAESTFTGRINTQGQKAMAASTPVVLPSDQSDINIADGGNLISVDDGGGSLTVDGEVGDNGPSFPGTDFCKAAEYAAQQTDTILYNTGAGGIAHVTDIIITISGTQVDVTVGFGAGPTGDKIIAKLYGDARGGLTHQFRGDVLGATGDDITVTTGGAATVFVKIVGYEV